MSADAPAPAVSASRKSSFYAAMRILPQAQREAMYEIYAFCRAVDDIADEEGPKPAREAALKAWRADVEGFYAGAPAKVMPTGLVAAAKEFGLERDDFLAVIDGMAMDLDGPIRAPDEATLDLYCDRVASAVGRLSVKVFGTPRGEGRLLAYHLGRALQLTNILRDLDEDAAIGRLYLPREALLAAGVPAGLLEGPPQAALDHPAAGAACLAVLGRARVHFAESRLVMKRCPRATVRPARIMADVYAPMLAQMERRGFAPPRTRVASSKWRALLSILIRSF